MYSSFQNDLYVHKIFTHRRMKRKNSKPSVPVQTKRHNNLRTTPPLPPSCPSLRPRPLSASKKKRGCEYEYIDGGKIFPFLLRIARAFYWQNPSNRRVAENKRRNVFLLPLPRFVFSTFRAFFYFCLFLFTTDLLSIFIPDFSQCRSASR